MRAKLLNILALLALPVGVHRSNRRKYLGRDFSLLDKGGGESI